MMSIKDLLNKIKWDRQEKPEEYVLVYYDRNGEEVNIPLHRVRQVKKKGMVVWERA